MIFDDVCEPVTFIGFERITLTGSAHGLDVQSIRDAEPGYLTHGVSGIRGVLIQAETQDVRIAWGDDTASATFGVIAKAGGEGVLVTADLDKVSLFRAAVGAIANVTYLGA